MGRISGPVLLPSSLLLGSFSLVAQVLLVREIFVIYYGSELNIGIVLAAWLFWVGAGSLAGTRIPPVGRRALLPALQAGAALALPVTVLAIRSLRLWLPAAPGEYFALGTTVLATAGFLATPALLFGLWFTLAASLPSKGRTGPGRTYAWEAVGALVAGCVFTFFLADRVEGLQLAIAVTAAAVPLSLAAALPPRFERSRLSLSALGVLAAAALILLPSPEPLRGWIRLTQVWRWPGMEMVDSRDSRYGNLALLRLSGQSTLFENGTPGFSFPDPLAPVASLHLPLLAVPDPGRILLIGGGLGGGLGEALRHPVVAIDYIELDPEAVEIVRRHLPPHLKSDLEDPRVRVLHHDGRAWLSRNSTPYDAIILNLPDPATAMINRYYTGEFFDLVRRNLSPEGIFAFSLSSSPNYYSLPLRFRNGSVYRTLGKHFPSTAVVAADRNILLATPSEKGISLEKEVFRRRLRRLEGGGDYLRPEMIESLLDPARREFIEGELTAEEVGENRDFSPSAYFYHTLLWSGRNDSGIALFLRKLLGPARFLPFFIPPLLLLFGLGVSKTRKGREGALPLGRAALTTGWSSMTLQYLVLFTFQTDRGHLYRQIGLLNGAFMAGLAAGGFLSLHLQKKGTAPASLFRLSEALLTGWPVLLGLALHSLTAARSFPGPLADAAYAGLAGWTGLFAGFQFPLYAPLHGSGGPGAAGGRYYFFDLTGSGTGVLLVSLWLLPLLGIWQALLLCTALKGATLLPVMRAARGRAGPQQRQGGGLVDRPAKGYRGSSEEAPRDPSRPC